MPVGGEEGIICPTYTIFKIVVGNGGGGGGSVRARRNYLPFILYTVSKLEVGYKYNFH